MYTFSEALYIMDHNTERLMVSELQDAVNELRDKVSGLQAERNTIQTERDVFRLRLKGKAYEEISAELSISFDSVKKILESKP
ncbi:hypothetical protein AALA79_06735 [Lachnospiraceae bacterium 64-25]|mgnify:CR=1 FL=1